MNTEVTFKINIADNATNVVKQLTDNINGLNVVSQKSGGSIKNAFSGLFYINNIADYFTRLSDTINGAIQPGIAFDKSLQDLSAITGVTGDGLKEIGGYAKEVAKNFGVDASQSVESFKLILSQLTPELGKSPAVMKKMGEDIAILSKTMGGDTTAAAQVLTTAMNQYGVSMDNPIQAEKEMSNMMNVMAAAAKEGSAELPQIKEALEQCGMAAKTANVSFEETNAAIQVLDKAGKKGAEGGVALRNVMTILAQGRFMPKDTKEALNSAGVSLKALTDKGKTLQEKMQLLKPVMNDQALLTKMFGRENTAAAIALIQNSDAIGEYKSKITGTNTAVEQSKTVMQSYEEKQKKVAARIEEIKIGLFDATKGFSMYASIVASSLVPLAQMIPLIKGLSSGFMVARSGVLKLASSMKFLASASFYKNIHSRLLGMVLSFKLNCAVAGGFWKMLGLTVKSGAISMLTSVKILCKGIGSAIKGIPVFGWIIAVVAALAGLFIYFWNTSVKFRAVVKGSCAYVVSLLKEMWGVVKNIFTAIADIIKSAITLDFAGVKNATKKLTNTFTDFGKKSAEAYNKAYNEEMTKGKKEEKAGKVKKPNVVSENNSDNGLNGKKGGGKKVRENAFNTGGSIEENSKGKASGGGKNITTNIHNLLNGNIIINTNNLKEGAAEIKRTIIEAMTDATNEMAYE